MEIVIIEKKTYYKKENWQWEFKVFIKNYKTKEITKRKEYLGMKVIIDDGAKFHTDISITRHTYYIYEKESLRHYKKEYSREYTEEEIEKEYKKYKELKIKNVM